MAGKLLFQQTLAEDPDARTHSHSFLEKVDRTQYPYAECREDDGAGIYEVWSDRQDPNPNTIWVKPVEEKSPKSTLSEEQIAAIAAAVAQALKGAS